jgi:flagellar basal body-associated protein FliL
MAIASMVCGITGLLGFIISSISILNLLRFSYIFEESLFGEFFQIHLQTKMTTAVVFAVISFALMILAFIFGIIERKKGKAYQYYGIVNAGFVMGLAGIILQLLLIIFITRTVITYNAILKSRQGVLTPPILGYYIADDRSIHNFVSTYTITTTKDFPVSYSVTAEVMIFYDVDDQNTATELANRYSEIRNFVQHYFSNKYAEELAPEKEKEIKTEILNIINTSFLETAGARNIFFNRLDVQEIQ